MNELLKAVAAADEDFLVSLANKGLYKRAVKDIDGVAPDIKNNGDTAEISVGGETVTLKTPLTECKCSCVSRTVCRHILSAILLMKSTVSESASVTADNERPEPQSETKTENIPENKPETTPEPEDVTEKLTAKQIEKINICAKQSLAALEDILKHGLVRVPDAEAENLEVNTVRCHALKMADAERAVRELGGKLGDCIARRASFSIRIFTEKFFDCVKLLSRLSESNITANELGVFRQKYDACNDKLTILPIGQRQVAGGEYEGDIYYFLNMDENAKQRFLTLSDLRPVFYEVSERRRTAVQNVVPWGLGTPLKNMMRTKMVLGNAKINGGKLSSSQETSVLAQTAANLDCPELHSIIMDDFSAAAAELFSREVRSEADRLFFIHPTKVNSSVFDKYTQTFLMNIEDCNGRTTDIKVKYRAETKEFIETLEKIGKKILENQDTYFVMLVSAYTENGRLNFFPIEVYDFITPQPHKDYILPDEYKFSEEDAYYAYAILSTLSDVRNKIEITLQCGLQSGGINDKELENKLNNCGLKGLAKLTAEFMSAAESYRHGGEKTAADIIVLMSDILTYIAAAQNKLEIITAMQ